MTTRIKSITVYGAGSWGTALALQLARNGLNVMLWGRQPEHTEYMQQHRVNQLYLPDILLPDNIKVTNDFAQASAFANYHLVVISSVGIRGLLHKLNHYWQETTQQQYILCATKGIEVESGKLMHQIFAEELSTDIPYAMISGPSFAKEVAQDLPTALTVASTSTALAQDAAQAFNGEQMRVYLSSDVIGVELGGSIKNVLAIAAGISDGLGFGANARAALITRGLAEVGRLAKYLGADPQSMMGLSGIGDLVLTCTDDQSRNRRLGLAIGKGQDLQTALDEIGQAVEGVKTAKSIRQLAHKTGVDMPICHEVYEVLFAGQSPELAVKRLLSRKTKTEY